MNAQVTYGPGYRFGLPCAHHPDEIVDRQYAMLVAGNCMLPEIPTGAYVIAEPAGAVESGDLVIVYTKDVGADVIRAMVKVFVSRDDYAVLLQMRNPDTLFYVDADRIVAMHVITGIWRKFS